MFFAQDIMTKTKTAATSVAGGQVCAFQATTKTTTTTTKKTT